MSGRALIERVEISKISLEYIKGGYDPSKEGFDIDGYLAMPEKEREEIYRAETDKFFQSSFNGGTIESCLNELKFDSRFTEGLCFLLFTEGAFHSVYKGSLSNLIVDTNKKIQETKKMWFYEELMGYGYEHYVDGIMGFGEPYDMRIDLKKEV
jgi:hypothetical protein